MDNKLVSIVKELYEALPKGDLAPYEKNTHADFKIVESDSLPFSGVFRGMKGFHELIEKVMGLFSEFDPEPTIITSGDNTVMVWVKLKLTGRNTNRSITTEMIEVFKFEGDKIIEIQPFYFNSDEIKSIV